MEKKITKLEVIEMMMRDEAISGNEVYMEYLKSEQALRSKRKINKKATKVQEENEVIKAEILVVLENANKGMTVTEITRASEDLAEYSNQKMTALVKQLLEAGKVTKSVDKGKALFTLVK